MIDKIIETHPYDSFLKAEGLDAAIIGVDMNGPRLIYSVSLVLSILMQEMSETDANEHFDYNIAGGYVGEQTPVWCYDNFQP